MSDASSSAFRWRFDAIAALWAAGLFIVLVLLATVGARWGWVRSFGGDVLAVAWVYCVFKAVCRGPVAALALAAWGVGVLLEGAQWLAAVNHWHLSNRALRIVLGSTADVWDVVAYTLGAIFVLAAERTARVTRRV